MGGNYVKVRAGDALITFEQTSESKYLIRGEAPVLGSLEELCFQVSQVLQRNGVKHRLEVYNGANQLACTFTTSEA
jgi:hypothetical protein